MDGMEFGREGYREMDGMEFGRDGIGLLLLIGFKELGF